MRQDRGLGRRRRLARGGAAAAVLALAIWCAAPASRPSAQPAGRNAANPLVGAWTLNAGRTHYGPGVEPRVRETFECVERAGDVACTIRSAHAGGRRVAGSFAAALDGRARPVAGIAGIDRVVLRAAAGGAVDATFSRRGTPVFGYRAFRGGDGRSLSVVSVDPVSRAVLTTVVVYDAR